MLYFVDATHLYSKELVERCGGKITDVWLFDMRTGTRCCEARLSYEMEYFDSVAIKPPEDDEQREELLEDLSSANAVGQEPFKAFLIEGALRRMTVDAEEYPTTWDYETTPAVLSIEMPDEKAWQEFLDNEDGNVREAHLNFWEEIREKITANSPY